MLGVKDSLHYYETVKQTNPDNTIRFIGGVAIGATEAGIRYFPILDVPREKTSFDLWWNKILIVWGKNSTIYTRKDVVCAVADMDGGAHVDHALDAAYSELSRNYNAAWEVFTPYGPGIVENGPELPIVRGTAYLLELTLSEQLADWLKT
jgi:hypothetical protein